MNTTLNKKSFLFRLSMVFAIIMLILPELPVQTALAATSGFTPPNTFSNSTLSSAGNAYVSDNLYAQATGNNKSAVYGNFGFLIPTGATINLIEVSVESHGTKNWKVAVSKDNGATYSAYVTIINTATDTVTVTSGAGTLWGLTGWTSDSLTNTKFKVKIASAGGSSSNTAYLDQLMVRVTYTPVNATPTTLVVTLPSAGTYGGTTNLQATLTANGTPLSGKTISFLLDGFSRGTAITNASGVATLSGVTLTTGLANTLLNVGSYVVSAEFAGDGNYAYSSGTNTQTVNQRPITITADSKTKVYGSNDPVFTYQITNGSLVGSDAFSGYLTRAAGENVGSYAILQGTVGINPNYVITYIGNSLSITPLELTITADNKAIHTGDPDPTFTFSTSRFVGSDTLITNPTCSVPDPHTTAGTYSIICSGADAGANYTISYVNGTLTVTDKIILTVTADNKTITYGDADPTFTFTYSGFVNNDDPSVINTPPTCTVVVPHANVGAYPAIICGGGVDDTYEFSYVSGTLTVNPRAVTITADPQTKTYGNADPAFTYQITNGSLVGGDNFSGVLSRITGENVGTYAITQGTLTLGMNYTITYTGNNLTINQATLTVTADDKIMVLGGSDPVFTFTYDGLVNGDDATVIDTPPTCSVSVAHTTLGTYPITCSGGIDNNYSFSYVAGTLTVALNQIGVTIGTNPTSYYALASGQDSRQNYPVSGGPVVVASTNSLNLVAAIRLQSFTNNILYSFKETTGVPSGLLSYKYYFPSYNNIWAPLNSQIRFANLDPNSTTIRVTIGIQHWDYAVPGLTEQRITQAVSGGPVTVESLDPTKKIVAAIRLQSLDAATNTLYSFAETRGIPAEYLSDTYYFPSYNNIWAPLDSQVRFAVP